ncbi:hypothetical protein HPB47_021499 [Ixodes persulcatus]|uniref:Uncharacterized protein n=1 Tax=Ixodes persulcatus TaxID=34615 RepID=A0AC60QZL4_IXOPE|nr:hypothetical protein HPB47_021499 [Ixodes persulcatus]
MNILCEGDAKIQAPHRADPSKTINIAFDQSHIIKNIRSQFLAKDIGGKQEEKHPADMCTADKRMRIAEEKLTEQCLSPRPCHSNPDIASVSVLGGYIVRAANGHIPYGDCTALLQGQELVKLLIRIRRFPDTALFYRKSIPKPLEVCVQGSVFILMDLPIPTCENKDMGHRQQLLERITRKFLKPLFSNYALGLTNRSAAVKLY